MDVFARKRRKRSGRRRGRGSHRDGRPTHPERVSLAQGDQGGTAQEDADGAVQNDQAISMTVSIESMRYLSETVQDRRSRGDRREGQEQGQEGRTTRRRTTRRRTTRRKGRTTRRGKDKGKPTTTRRTRTRTRGGKPFLKRGIRLAHAPREVVSKDAKRRRIPASPTRGRRRVRLRELAAPDLGGAARLLQV